MANWNDIKKSIGTFAGKTATKTREIADTASTKIKIANKEAERDTQYKILGKYAYAKLRDLNVSDPDALTANISKTLEKLDGILKDISDLRAEEEARKLAKQEEKAERQEAKRRAEMKDEEELEQLNRRVMEGFNDARADADAEYEKARAAAKAATQDNK